MHRIVILAAGKGTRMGSELPKALFPLKGRPMIEYLLDSILASGVDQKPLVVVSPDNKDVISSSLSGYDLEYVIQDKQLGTGHAVASTKSFIGEEYQGVIVLYCDHPFISSKAICGLAKLTSFPVSLMPTKVSDFDDWRSVFKHWGRILRDQSGRLVGIEEFKDAPEDVRKITEVNPGVMRFDREWLWDNIDKLANENAQHEYYLTDLPKIAFSEGFEIGSLSIDPLEAIGVNSQEEVKIAESFLSK